MGQIKQVFRRLSRSPLFTALTLLTLAVGIGANTAIFSVVDGVLLKPLPYPEPDRLVGVWESAPGLGIPEMNACPATYYTFREESKTFQESGIWRRNAVSVTGLAEPERVRAVDVTDGVLPALGVQPMLGRLFTRQDDAHGSPETIILTYGYWQRKFGADPGVIGRRILVDSRAREVIGVMPRNFRFLNVKAEALMPLQLNRSEVFIGQFSFQGLARLKPGVSLAQANADVARMLPLMRLKFRMPPGMNEKMLDEARFGPSIRPLQRDVVGDIGKVLWVIMGTLGIVLFIACANVANLLLVRAEGRQQELAVRAALGAGWGRIARDLLLESLLLGAAGGALGLALAYAGIRALIRLGPASLPRLDEITLDLPVLLFTVAISLFAGLTFGLIPVFKYASPAGGFSLREGNRSVSAGKERHRARSILVVVQVSLALVLLIGSGLMIRTFQALKHVQPGFTHPEDILSLRISIPEAQVKEPERAIRMDNEIIRKITDIPGVSSAAATNSITMDGQTDNDPVFAEDRTYAEGTIPPMRRFKFVSPGSFATMGNPLLSGRDFTWTDVYNLHPVVLVSENFAREFWHSPANALGKRIRENPKGAWREIIGVVGNEHDNGVDEKAPTVVYWPLLVKDFWFPGVVARRDVAIAVRSARAGSAGLLKQVQAAVWSVNPDLPISDVGTVQDIYDKSLARTSFTLVILAIAAAMAMLLGLIGIYGVISYSVSQRTREIGIRMALGAPRENVTRMFVSHGLRLTCIGVGCGLVAAIALTRLMKALLYDVSALDPLTYIAVSLALVTAAAFASYLPARGATGIDPIAALRAE